VSFEVKIKPDCGTKKWQALTGVPTKVLAFQETSFVVPTKLELDSDNLSWSNSCPGNAVISALGMPSWVKLNGAVVTINANNDNLVQNGHTFKIK
jgi:hypothetical protein